MAAPRTTNKDEIYDQFVAVITEHIILGIAATIALALRFNARRLTKSALRWDDWLAVVAWVCMMVRTVLTWLVNTPSAWVLVLPNQRPDLDKITYLMKLNFASQFIVSTCQVAARLSIIFLYHRLFSVKTWLRHSLTILTGLSICWLTTMYIGTVFTCAPIRASFDATVKGKCVDGRSGLIATNSIDSALDAAVLALPVPVILGLKLPLRERVGVVAIFLTGGIVVVTGAVRTYLAANSKLTDRNSASNTALWNGLHLAFAVICCCLPVFRVYLPRKSLTSSRFTSFYRLLTEWVMRTKTGSSRSGSKGSKQNQDLPLPSFVQRSDSEHKIDSRNGKIGIAWAQEVAKADNV